MCFLWASTTSIDIKTLTYSGRMANRCDDNHHHNNVEVEDLVLTRAEFYQFREEMKQFHEESQQDMREIWQVIATLLARKSSHNNMDQYIQKRTPNYKKIPFFDREMHKLDFIKWLLDLEEYFNF